MNKCEICGNDTDKDLYFHVKKYHKDITWKEYRIKYPNSKRYTEEKCEKIKKYQKEKWSDPEYKNDLIDTRKDIYKSDSWKESRKKGYEEAKKNGRIKESWSKGKTKYTDDRLKFIGEFNSNNLSGRTKENYEYLKKHSEFMKINGLFTTNNPTLNKTEEEKTEWRKKISETISERIASGDLVYYTCTKDGIPLRNFKNGFFKSKFGLFFYASGLELETMQYFESCDFIKHWTIHHGIRIKYINPINNTTHNYIPDFMVEMLNGKTIIIETKGIDSDIVQIKKQAAEKIYEYYLCFNLKQVKGVINEISKNK